MRDTEGSLDTDDDVAETLGLLVFWRFCWLFLGVYIYLPGVLFVVYLIAGLVCLSVVMTVIPL